MIAVLTVVLLAFGASLIKSGANDGLKSRNSFSTDPYADDVFVDEAVFSDFSDFTGAFAPMSISLTDADSATEETESGGEATASNVGFTMFEGAGVRLNETTGLRFKATVPASLITNTFGFIIAPLDYFQKAESYLGDNASGDYLRDLEAWASANAKATPYLKLTPTPDTENGKYVIRASVGNILYKNSNREFTAAAYFETTAADGTVVRKYATYPGGGVSDCARAVTYVATAALQDAQGGYTETEKNLLRGFVNRGIDLAYGLTEAESALVSVRTVSYECYMSQTDLTIGETLELYLFSTVNCGAEDRLVELPKYWKSSDETVAIVDRNGKITAVGAGTANISVCFGEYVSSYSVTVVASANVALTDASGSDVQALSTEHRTVTARETFQAPTAGRSLPLFYGFGSETIYADYTNLSASTGIQSGSADRTSVRI